MATKKPKTKTPKKRALDLTRLLKAVDNKNYEFYDTLTPEELKEFSPLVLMRFISNMPPGDRDLQEWYLDRVNELVNKDHWKLSKNHKGLLWKLYASVGGGAPAYHEYLPAKRNEFNNFEKLIGELYPAMKFEEVKMLAAKMNDDDLEELFDQMGFDKNQRKEYR
jgi:hypothetical protein